MAEKETNASGVRIGLCAGCANVHIVETDNGSKFFLCELSRTDPQYPKYPRLPVLSCNGFKQIDSAMNENGASRNR